MSIEKGALGAAIKSVRLARGLTQVELAQSAGLSTGGKSIALIEQGKRFVSVDTLNALAKALDIPPACLAILGSRSIGENAAAIDFMKSLQTLISSIVVAQTSLGGPEKRRPKRDPVVTERRRLAETAKQLRGLSKQNQAKVTAMPKTRTTKQTPSVLA